MLIYQELLAKIQKDGVIKSDRTGTGTKSIFGYQMRFNLEEGFPLLTTKRVYLKGIIHELLWFIKGDTNIKYLVDNNVHIWDNDAYRHYVNIATAAGNDYMVQTDFIVGVKRGSMPYEGYTYGDLGPVYGKQWRNCTSDCESASGIDQLQEVIDLIKNNPDSRRIIMSAWNVGQIDSMALPPCHTLCQFYVSEGKLSCQLYQRSADVFLGVPFNIASYALLTQMLAQVCDLKVGELVHCLGDAHLYLNHLDQADEQLLREPRVLPKMHINPNVKNINDFVFEDFALAGYDPHPVIKGDMSC